jgi:PAS domain S-box-containing protein
MEGRPALNPRLRAALDEIPALVLVMHGPDLVVVAANPRRPGLPQGAAVEGMTAERMLEHALAESESRATYLTALRRVLTTGETLRVPESPVVFAGSDRTTYWDAVLIPLREAPGAAPDGVVLHAVEVTGLVEARRRAEEAEHRFTTLTDANVTGVTVTDEERVYEANDAFLAMVGRTRAELEAGLRWTDLTEEGSIEADQRALESLATRGVAPPYEKTYVRPDGKRVPVMLSASVLSERPLRVLATYYELTERRSAEAEIAALLARTRRLQEITATLSASNAAADISRAVVHHGLEELSASAGIVVRGTGDLEVEYAVGFDPEALEQWRTFPATLPAELTAAAGTIVGAGALLEGGTAIAVPLVGGDGSRLGVAALAFRGPRALEPAELDFLHALARQAGLALDRIRLYEDRAYVARKLQEGLLPERLDDVPGLEAAVVYESTSGGGEVGGDFYDLFASGDGQWTMAVGDVCGKGTEAAVITGLARHTIRAVAQTTHSPSEILGFLNGALRRHAAVPSFCTVGCASLAPAPAGGFIARVSSGGHPFPFVLRADGVLEEVEVLGTMLGVTDTPELVEVRLDLHAGDALIVYTDGVTDARPQGGERFGEARLEVAVRGAAGGTAEQIAADIEGAVRAHLPGPSADDRAILVLRVSRAAGP